MDQKMQWNAFSAPLPTRRGDERPRKRAKVGDNECHLSRSEFYKKLPKQVPILKDDIRKKYILILRDAFNSCDVEMMWAFCKACCSKDLTWVQSCHEMNQSTNFPRHLVIVGRESIAEYWYLRGLLEPDYLFFFSKGSLHVRSDGLAYLDVNINLISTHLHGDCPRFQTLVNGFDWRNSTKERGEGVDTSNEEDSDAAMSTKISNKAMEKYEQIITMKMLSSVQETAIEDIVQEPYRYCGHITMHINKELAIYRIELSIRNSKDSLY